MSDEKKPGLPAPAEEQSKEDLLACHKVLLDELREKHGEIEVVRAPHGFEQVGVIVCACPSKTHYRAFLDAIANDKFSNAIAAENLAQATVVHPPKDVLKQIFEAKPGLPMKIAAIAQRLAGGEAEELGKI